MPITVNSNSSATLASFNLTNANNALRKSLTRLSSGKRIVNPPDDASGLAVASKLESRLIRTTAVRQNNLNALSYLHVQDGALRTIGNIVDRIAELRTMASDVTKNTQDIENYSKEFIELQSELQQISKAQFNGISLFTLNNAEHKEGTFHRVDDGIEYDGTIYNKYSRIASTHEDGDYNSGHVSINVVNLSYMIPFMFGGVAEFGGAGLLTDGGGAGASHIAKWDATNGQFLSVEIDQSAGGGYAVGEKLIDPIDNIPIFEVTAVDGMGAITSIIIDPDYPNPNPDWQSFPPSSLTFPERSYDNITSLSVETFVDVIERIANVRAENGAEQNTLNMVDDSLLGKQISLEAAHGRIMDADMAIESTRFARQNVLVQSSAAMVAQANQLTSISLTLLG